MKLNWMNARMFPRPMQWPVQGQWWSQLWGLGCGVDKNVCGGEREGGKERAGGGFEQEGRADPGKTNDNGAPVHTDVAVVAVGRVRGRVDAADAAVAPAGELGLGDAPCCVLRVVDGGFRAWTWEHACRRW